MKILLDTSALIDQIQGDVEVGKIIERATKVGVSPIVFYELCAGMEKEGGIAELRNNFSEYQGLPFTIKDAVTAAEIYHALSKKGQRVNTSDILIAAQALEHGLTIITKDSDFESIKSVSPYLSVLKLK
jgi:predicted nucleic acid-binding protein